MTIDKFPFYRWKNEAQEVKVLTQDKNCYQLLKPKFSRSIEIFILNEINQRKRSIM